MADEPCLTDQPFGKHRFISDAAPQSAETASEVSASIARSPQRMVNAQPGLIGHLESLGADLLKADLCLALNSAGRLSDSLNLSGSSSGFADDKPVCSMPCVSLMSRSNRGPFILEGTLCSTPPGENWRSFSMGIWTPLEVGGRTLGVFVALYTKARRPSENESRIFARLAAGVVAALSAEQERRELEREVVRSEQMLNNILIASPIAISYLEQGRIKWTNRAMLEIFGDSEDEAYTGMSAREFYVSDDEYNRIRRILYERLGRFEVAQADAQFRRLDGSIFDGRICISAPDPLNPRNGTVVTISDISPRKEAEKGLSREKHKFERLVENAPFGVAMIGEDGALRYINPTFRRLFGYELPDVPTMAHWFAKACPDESVRRDIEEAWNGLLGDSQPGERGEAVFHVTCKDGKEKLVNFRPVRLDTGEYMMTCEDITEREAAEEALRRSEEKYRSLYEKSLRADDIYRSLLNSCADAIVIYDMDGNAKYVSDSFTQIFGWSLEEVQGRRIPYVPEPEISITRRKIEGVILKGLPNCGFETKRLTKDGRLLDVSISASRYHDHEGNPEGMLVIVTDVTERKQAEEALARSERQLRQLSAQLLTAQENERKRLAQELHDGIGQSLTAIKFRVENTLKQASAVSKEAHEESLARVVPLIQNAIEEVRRITIDLRPSMLDDLGILTTITWFCREFQSTYGSIEIVKDIQVLENQVPAPLKILIFRIVQEALNNVAKHSGADHVRIGLRMCSERLELTIADNGSGFDPNAALSADTDRKGFGLVSMRERTEGSGGIFTIETGPRSSTVLRASWPIRPGFNADR